MTKRMIFLLLGTLFFLTGCGTQVYNIHLSESGDAKLEMVIQRTERLNNLLLENSVSEKDFEAIVEEELEYYQDRGFVTEYKSDEITLEKKYGSIEEMDADIRKLYKGGRIGLNISSTKNWKFLEDEVILGGRVEYYLPKKIKEKIDAMKPSEKQELESFIQSYGHESTSLNVYYPTTAKVNAMDSATRGNGVVAFLGSSKEILQNPKDLEQNVGIQVLTKNKPVMYGGSTLVVALIGIVIFMVVKKKKEDGEEE